MSQKFMQIGVLVVGLVLTCLGFWVSMQLWANYPPGNPEELSSAFWSQMPLPATWYARAVVYVWYGISIGMGAWPLVFVALSGVLATWLAYKSYGSEELAAYLDRVYALEQLRDKTQKREEELLSRWENLNTSLDKLYEKSGEMWMVVAPEGRVRRWNHAAMEFCRRFHPTIESLEGQSMADLWRGYTASALAPAVVEAARAGQVWHGELQLAGEGVHLLAWVWPLGDEVALLLRDVSSTYQPESSLQSAEALVRQLVEDSTQRPIAVLDTQWRYLYVSRRWNELFHLDPKLQLVGQPHTRVVPYFPPDVPKLAQQLAVGHAVGNDEEKVTIAGREEVLSWSIRPWRDAENRLAGYIANVMPATELSRLRAQVKQAQERENALAYADTLTGLPNRQLFTDRLNMSLALAYRQLSKVALVFIDLDGFKKVNDTLGHEYGDMLLKQVAQRLKAVMRDTDTVARLGGDEFTAILSVREKVDAELVAQKIIQTLGAPFDLAGKEANIGGSLGVALYPTDAATAADLIRKADACMYEAKKAGKNTYRFASKEIVIAG